MTVERPKIGLSEKQIEELKSRFELFIPNEYQAMISLDLEPPTREGPLKHHKREINFLKLVDGTYVLHVTEPSSRDPGYDQQREPTVEEITIFVEIATLQAPESPMTTALIAKAEELLTSQKNQLLSKLGAVDQALNFISSQKK